jgi:Bacterial mobilisation protein (MobC)
MPTIDRRAYKAEHRDKQKQAGVRRMTITLSPDEVARLKFSAARHGMRDTTHLKACALSGLDTRYMVPSDMSERLDDLVAILRGVGNNLNQLARHSNEMRAFMHTGEVQLQLRRLEEEVHHFVTEPPREASSALGSNPSAGHSPPP